jgi:hypothetical protein
MKFKKTKILIGAIACLAGMLLSGAGFAVWTFATSASVSNDGTIAVGTAINVKGCKVYNTGDTTNKSTATATLNLTSPTSASWTIAKDVTTWTVEVDGDLSGAKSVSIKVTVTPPTGFDTYCSIKKNPDGPTMTIDATTRDNATGDFTLPGVSYTSAFVSGGMVLDSGSATPSEVFDAMKTALNGKTITFEFDATASE